MKPIAWMAATAAMGIVVGFLVGRNAGPDAGNPSTAGEKERPGRDGSSQRDRPGRGGSGAPGDEMISRLTGGRSIRSLTSTDVTEIIRKNVNTDRNEDPVAAARRNYQLQLLLSQLPAEVLADATKEVMEDEKLRSSEGYKVFNVWARRDWKGALEWADNGTPGSSQWVGYALSALSSTDPDLAAKLMSDRVESGKFSDMYYSTSNIGRDYAKMGKEALMRYIDTLPSAQQQNALSGAIRDLPESDLESMVDEMYSRRVKGDEWSFNNSFSQFMRTNPEKAKAWLEKMPPGEERAKLEISAATHLMRGTQSADGLAMLKNAMTQVPGKEKELMRQAISNAWYAGPEMFSQLADALPPGVEMTAKDCEDYGSSISVGNGQNFLNIAKIIHDPAERLDYITGRLDQAVKNLDGDSNGRGLNDVDLRMVESRLAALNLKGESAQRVNAAFEKVREAAVNARTRGK